MAKIANVALTNTFDTWRLRSNASFDRLSQFAINNSSLYANTITANNVLKASGNTVLGAAGKRTVVNGLLSANGRVTVGTNLTVSGNTSVVGVLANNSLGLAGYFLRSDGSKAYWDSLPSSTQYLQVANAVATYTTKTDPTTSGLFAHTGRVTISTNIAVSGNTSLSTGASNTFVNFNGARLTNFSEYANTSINTGSAITVPSDSNFVRYTVNAATTVTLPANATNPGAAPAVKTVILFFKQNGTGTYSVTLAAPSGGTIKYNNSASQPAVNTGANKVTIYHCMKFDGDNTWYVSQSYIDA
jgi:hypothetical protein